MKEFQRASADPEFEKRLWESSDRFHRTCLFFPLPLIAAVNGPAIAGGFDLATMYDTRIACKAKIIRRSRIIPRATLDY